MRKEYDFSTSVKNPYAKKVKKQISLNIEVETIEYFKSIAAKTGMPYQTLINPTIVTGKQIGRAHV